MTTPSEDAAEQEGASVLMVPGYTGSDPGHWQSLWTEKLRNAGRVEQRDWEAPEREAWNRTLVEAVEETAGPLVLVGHSLGCMTIVDAAADLASTVLGAMLVAPSDPEAPSAPEPIRVYAPTPLERLPFRTMLVFSENDPFLKPARAVELGRAWGSQVVTAGRAGHLNTESGHGAWDHGFELLERFLARVRSGR